MVPAPWHIASFRAPWLLVGFLAPQHLAGLAYGLPGPLLVLAYWLLWPHVGTGLMLPWPLLASWLHGPLLAFWLPVTWLHGRYHPTLAYWLPRLTGTCMLPGTHCLLAPWPLAGFLLCWLPVLLASCHQAPWLHTHFLVPLHHTGLLAPCPLVGFTSPAGIMLATWVYIWTLAGFPAPWQTMAGPLLAHDPCHHAHLLASRPRTTTMTMLAWLFWPSLASSSVSCTLASLASSLICC